MKWRPGGVTSGVILCACRQHRAALAGRWFTWKSARSGRCLASPKKQPATPCNIRWFTGELVRRLARGVTSHCGNLASRRSGEDERNYRLCRTPGKAGARRCNAHSSVRLGNMRQLSPADNKCQIGIREFASRPVLWAGVPVPIRSTPGLLRAAAPGNEESIDNIIGTLNVKDLLMIECEHADFSLSNYMRLPYYTFEYKKITDLFRDMKKEKNHMAVVLDEYGGTVGIITLEDLVEEIVGDISDEYDEDETEIDVIKEDEYVVSGSVRLEDINDLIGTSIESEEFDSVGGFIIGQLGRLPAPSEEIEYNNIKFVIEDIDKNRIRKVRIFT